VPTYQYACTECGHQLEAVQSFSDAALTECPACHGKLRKVFNSVGIVFKGSGLYRNDSRSGAVSTEKSNGADKKPADASSTPASTSATPSAGSSSGSSSSTSSASSAGSSSGSAKAAAAS
jgi:putative FmdB family regulatory protein